MRGGVETSKHCFLCLQEPPSPPDTKIKEKEDAVSAKKPKSYIQNVDTQLFGLQKIYKLIKPDLPKLTNRKLDGKPANDADKYVDMKVPVWLCEECLKVTEHFSSLCLELEVVQLKVNLSMQGFLSILQKSRTVSVDRMAQIRGKIKMPEDRIRVTFAEDLRQETEDKCREHLNKAPIPRSELFDFKYEKLMPIRCAVCKSRFSGTIALHEHMRDKHDRAVSPPRSSSLCNQLFPKGPKLYPCSKCGNKMTPLPDIKGRPRVLTKSVQTSPLPVKFPAVKKSVKCQTTAIGILERLEKMNSIGSKRPVAKAVPPLPLPDCPLPVQILGQYPPAKPKKSGKRQPAAVGTLERHEKLNSKALKQPVAKAVQPLPLPVVLPPVKKNIPDPPPKPESSGKRLPTAVGTSSQNTLPDKRQALPELKIILTRVDAKVVIPSSSQSANLVDKSEFSIPTPSDKKYVVCRHCDKCFKNSSCLTRHVKSKHEHGKKRQSKSTKNSKPTKIACQFCGKALSSNSALYRHQRKTCTQIVETTTVSSEPDEAGHTNSTYFGGKDREEEMQVDLHHQPDSFLQSETEVIDVKDSVSMSVDVLPGEMNEGNLLLGDLKEEENQVEIGEVFLDERKDDIQLFDMLTPDAVEQEQVKFYENELPRKLFFSVVFKK